MRIKIYDKWAVFNEKNDVRNHPEPVGHIWIELGSGIVNIHQYETEIAKIVGGTTLASTPIMHFLSDGPMPDDSPVLDREDIERIVNNPIQTEEEKEKWVEEMHRLMFDEDSTQQLEIIFLYAIEEY